MDFLNQMYLLQVLPRGWGHPVRCSDSRDSSVDASTSSAAAPSRPDAAADRVLSSHASFVIDEINFDAL